MQRVVAAIASVLIVAAGEAAAATITGTVGFKTKRGQRPVVEETLVWLEAVRSTPAPVKAGSAVQILTRNKTLLPHVVAVPVGATIEFPNDDPISHNLFSLSPGNAFDLGLYRKGAGKAHRFEKPGVVNVYCNVHPNMSAVVHVMSTPWYAFADANGRYSIEVPPGRYRLVAWNEQGGTTESTVEVTEQAVMGNLDLTIDSRNFRLTPHKNKEGRPYRAPSSREY